MGGTLWIAGKLCGMDKITKRGGNLPEASNVPPLLSQSQTMVSGRFWNCQSVVKKADSISATALLEFSETWISPQNSVTLSLSSLYAYSITHFIRNWQGWWYCLFQRWCFTSTFSASSLDLLQIPCSYSYLFDQLTYHCHLLYSPLSPLEAF